jgi:hypothetical protein
MIDNILFQDINGLVLDIDVVNTGSAENILYDIIFQTLQSETGVGSCEGDTTSETIITIPKRYIERINNLSIFTP